MEIVKDEVESKKVATYDPNKSYGWKPEDVFVLNGNDFGLIINTLRAISYGPEAQKIDAVRKVAAAMETSLIAAVEAGIVFEKAVENKPKDK